MKALASTALALSLTLGAGIAIASGLDENVMDPGGPGTFRHQGPLVSVESFASMGGRHLRMDFFFVARPGSAPWIVARRLEDHLGKSPAVRWASSDTCPVLAPVTAELEQLRAPLIRVPGVKHATEPDLLLDGVAYSLWAHGAVYEGGRAMGAVQMTGNVDSPLAKWAQSAEARLKDCWADVKPVE
ncbi:MAG: hypothetical protein JSR45_08535 [Proteobacteria bacterium]|nr:hypothetical protein [Pseudomonadota bacterium]